MGGRTMVFAVEGMHCASCGLLVDEVVEEVTGVVSSATEVRAGRTVVTVAGEVDPVTVVAAIDGAGFAARAVMNDHPAPSGPGGWGSPAVPQQKEVAGDVLEP